jgi:hypothetical protein
VLCICLVVSVVLCFACLRPVSCVPNVANVSRLSILDCPSFFSKVYLLVNTKIIKTKTTKKTQHNNIAFTNPAIVLFMLQVIFVIEEVVLSANEFVQDLFYCLFISLWKELRSH